MDWKRAKNILIAMFLIINIFLSYQVFTISRNQYRYIDEDEMKNVLEYLDSRNIKMEGAIPSRVLIPPSVKVKYYEFDAVNIEKAVFAGADFTLEYRANGFVMSGKDITVDVSNGVFASYRNRGVEIRQMDVDEEKCLKTAYSFIDKLKLNSNNRYIKHKQVEKGYVRLVLGQHYKNIPIENSQIEIIATETGVASANINWFEWIRLDKRYNISTPVVALLKAYENRGTNAEPVVIRRIRQGYYFNPIIISGSETSIAVEGSAPPMWVIESDKGEIYVNAYNEKIENAK